MSGCPLNTSPEIHLVFMRLHHIDRGLAKTNLVSTWFQISVDSDICQQYRIGFRDNRCDINPIILDDIEADIADMTDG